jgi:hypothetical protein
VIREIVTTAAALAFALACGGGQQGSASANDAKSARDSQSDSNGSSPGESGDPESGPTLPSCDDGTCFRCGDSICPKGFYCDEDARGGPACGWIPACAEQASCACVKQAFGAACRCEEQGAGVSVACD